MFNSSSRVLAATLTILLITSVVLTKAESRPDPPRGATATGGLNDFSTPNGYAVYAPPTPSSGTFPGGNWNYRTDLPGLGANINNVGQYEVSNHEIPFRMQCEGTTNPIQSYSGTLSAVASTGINGTASASAHFQTTLGPQASISLGNMDAGYDPEAFCGYVLLDSSEGADFKIIVTVTVNGS